MAHTIAHIIIYIDVFGVSYICRIFTDEPTAKPQPEGRRMSLAQGVRAILMKSRQRPKFVIGHVRRFSKNISKNTKPPTPVKISPPSFYTVSYNDFIQKLMKSMDDFVVRKEIVTSSINFETITTVTFTRISVSSFQAKLRESIAKWLEHVNSEQLLPFEILGSHACLSETKTIVHQGLVYFITNWDNRASCHCILI